MPSIIILEEEHSSSLVCREGGGFTQNANFPVVLHTVN
jgi:hypothetical protein